MFVIAVEGAKTEPQYFTPFKSYYPVIHVKCLTARHRNSPADVLKRLQEFLRKERLKPSDEAWLVVDMDQRQEKELDPLHEWAQTNDNYGFALSNPKFEYWLLLHFEDASGISTSSQCSERLRKYLPHYDKSIEFEKLKDGIQDAIRRAKQKDNPPCTDWPHRPGTTVYKLVENILAIKT